MPNDVLIALQGLSRSVGEIGKLGAYDLEEAKIGLTKAKQDVELTLATNREKRAAEAHPVEMRRAEAVAQSAEIQAKEVKAQADWANKPFSVFGYVEGMKTGIWDVNAQKLSPGLSKSGNQFDSDQMLWIAEKIIPESAKVFGDDVEFKAGKYVRRGPNGKETPLTNREVYHPVSQDMLGGFIAMITHPEKMLRSMADMGDEGAANLLKVKDKDPMTYLNGVITRKQQILSYLQSKGMGEKALEYAKAGLKSTIELANKYTQTPQEKAKFAADMAIAGLRQTELKGSILKQKMEIEQLMREPKLPYSVKKQLELDEKEFSKRLEVFTELEKKGEMATPEEVKRKAQLAGLMGDIRTRMDNRIKEYAGGGRKGYGARTDGSEKGPGFLGELPIPKGSKMKGKDVSTELSIGVMRDGKEIEIPLLVPSLTPKEIKHALMGEKPTSEMVKKAIDHAKSRYAQGLSPFKTKEEVEAEKVELSASMEGFSRQGEDLSKVKPMIAQTKAVVDKSPKSAMGAFQGILGNDKVTETEKAVFLREVIASHPEKKDEAIRAFGIDRIKRDRDARNMFIEDAASTIVKNMWQDISGSDALATPENGMKMATKLVEEMSKNYGHAEKDVAKSAEFISKMARGLGITLTLTTAAKIASEIWMVLGVWGQDMIDPVARIGGIIPGTAKLRRGE